MKGKAIEEILERKQANKLRTNQPDRISSRIKCERVAAGQRVTRRDPLPVFISSFSSSSSSSLFLLLLLHLPPEIECTSFAPNLSCSPPAIVRRRFGHHFCAHLLFIIAIRTFDFHARAGHRQTLVPVGRPSDRAASVSIATLGRPSIDTRSGHHRFVPFKSMHSLSGSILSRNESGRTSVQSISVHSFAFRSSLQRSRSAECGLYRSPPFATVSFPNSAQRDLNLNVLTTCFLERTFRLTTANCIRLKNGQRKTNKNKNKKNESNCDYDRKATLLLSVVCMSCLLNRYPCCI